MGKITPLPPVIWFHPSQLLEDSDNGGKIGLHRSILIKTIIGHFPPILGKKWGSLKTSSLSDQGPTL